MKSKIKLFGIIAAVVVMSFTMMGCDTSCDCERGFRCTTRSTCPRELTGEGAGDVCNC